MAGLVTDVYVRVDRISLGGRAAAAGVFGRCRKRDCVRRREEDGKEKNPQSSGLEAHCILHTVANGAAEGT